MGMAAKRLDAADEADEQSTTQFNVRVPKFLLRDLDAWLAEINKGRRVGLMTRSDLVRLVLDRACREKPDFDK
jgi:predicted transcriptional regulator